MSIVTKWRHKKTGGIYIVLDEAKLQTAKPVEDMTEVVIYMAADGTTWVRPKDEFLDGRFEAVA